MNSINQTNLNERDISYNNQISLNKSEKFQDSINNMRLMMWNKFLSGVANNPQMTKKEVCHHLGLKAGTIKSIQQHYKLQSPFYFKKPKVHRKKTCEQTNEVVKPKKANRNKKSGGGNYGFDETFNKSVESLKK
jgi:hypothetical protein